MLAVRSLGEQVGVGCGAQLHDLRKNEPCTRFEACPHF